MGMVQRREEAGDAGERGLMLAKVILEHVQEGGNQHIRGPLGL